VSYANRLDDVTKLFDSLEGLETVSPDAGKALEIPLDEIEEDPSQPRQTFDPDALAELAASIKARGVIQAIAVTPKRDGGKHRIVMGARRYRAARAAGLARIPAIVREPTEEDGYDQMVENIQRDDLRPLEIGAFVAARLAAGDKPGQIAQRLGKAPAFVTMHAAIGEMPELLRALLETSPIRAVYELHQAWKKDQGAVEAFLAGRGAVTRADAVTFVQAQRADDNDSRRGRKPRRIEASPDEAVPTTSRAFDATPDRGARADESACARETHPARRRGAERLSKALLVQHGNRVARLRLDLDAQNDSYHAVVEFGPGELAELPLTELMLVEIVRR
jgi:ParB family transcriptional regulator, chromosome partitioning protein